MRYTHLNFKNSEDNTTLNPYFLLNQTLENNLSLQIPKTYLKFRTSNTILNTINALRHPWETCTYFSTPTSKKLHHHTIKNSFFDRQNVRTTPKGPAAPSYALQSCTFKQEKKIVNNK